MPSRRPQLTDAASKARQNIGVRGHSGHDGWLLPIMPRTMGHIGALMDWRGSGCARVDARATIRAEAPPAGETRSGHGCLSGGKQTCFSGNYKGPREREEPPWLSALPCLPWAFLELYRRRSAGRDIIVQRPGKAEAKLWSQKRLHVR